jgi:nucleolar protein 4
MGFHVAGIPMKDMEQNQKNELERVKKQVRVVAQGPGQTPNPSIRLSKSCTLLLSKLPEGISKKVLYKKVKKFGVVSELIVLDGDNAMESDTAKVVYATAHEAQSAILHLHDHIFKGTKIVAQIVETVTEASLAKKSRLIIRNLAFQCKKENLIQVFEVFGEVADCHVPQTSDGKARGFGFVQYKQLEDAKKALETVNGQKILGRPVAVDWALGKSEYNRLAALESAKVEEIDQKQADDNILETQDSIEDKINGQNEKEDEMDEDASSGTTGNEDGLNEDAEDAVIMDSDAESEFDNEPIYQKEKEEIPEGCTLFVRNLSFDTTKQTLQKLYNSLIQVFRLGYDPICCSNNG